jgi:maltokinase
LQHVVADNPVLVATVVAYLPGALDGWDWAVDDVRRLASGTSTMDDALAPVAQLATITAQMHAAFAATGRAEATASLVGIWADRAIAELGEAVGSVGGPEGARLQARSTRIAAVYDSFDGTVGTPLIDVHGDLHVGQMLRHGDPYQYSVTDFDGNPVLPPSQRNARQPAAVDVAGMLASLDHVGRVVIFRTEGVDQGVVRDWIARAQRTFRHSYLERLDQLGLAELFDERLLLPLRLQQEVREYLYAVRHLPHWLYVPDRALADLLPDKD